MQIELAPSPLPVDRKIPGPRYNLKKVQEAICDSNQIRLFTNDCIIDVQDMGWSIQNVLEFLQALTDADYRDSEWCATGKGLSVDCDSYAMRFDAGSACRSDAAPKIFIKFGFRPNHCLVLVISCHLS